MHAMELLSSKSTVVLSFIILWPHAPCSWLQLEVCLSFTESIDVSCWNLKINLYELVLENECLTRCIDQLLARPGALEPESKWISSEIEVDHVKSELLLALLLGYEIVRNIEAI